LTGTGELMDFIGRYGYLVIFLGVMAESAGVPLPGETVLIVSGALAHRGVLDLGDTCSSALLRP
jgi:membrane protein DedA with SNARE-associated domain